MFVQRDGFRPSLVIPGQSPLEPVQATTQSLKFLIPSSLQKAIQRSYAEPVSSILPLNVKLSIPYETGRIIKNRVNATYDVLLGILPQSPGQILLSRRSIVKTTHRVLDRSTQWKQHSSDDDLMDVLYEWADEGHPGCRVAEDSVKFVVDWQEGGQNDGWYYAFVRSNPSIVFRVTTIHRVFYTSGKLDFHFEFEWICEENTENWTQNFVDLTWGQSWRFEADPSDWVVTFTAFDNEVLKIVGPQLHRYLEVRVVDKSVVLTVPTTDRISY
jgi:hypothetical protein